MHRYTQSDREEKGLLNHAVPLQALVRCHLPTYNGVAKLEFTVDDVSALSCVVM